MNLLTAFFLGIIQGVTEFLPVSSSGHLILFQHLFGLGSLDKLLAFDIVCHLGTLLSIACIFSKKISFTFKNKTLFLQIVLATALLLPVALLSKSITALFDRIDLLGYFFLLTSLLLFLAHYFQHVESHSLRQKNIWRDSFIIGAAQTLAIMPGVSRSGATISVARIVGWPAEEAISFSFLLGMPAILGAAFLESIKLWSGPYLAEASLPLSCYLVGFFASFFTGLLALLAVIRLVSKDKFHYFAWYCLALGIITIATT